MGQRKAREEKARRERKKNHKPGPGNTYTCPPGPMPLGKMPRLYRPTAEDSLIVLAALASR